MASHCGFFQREADRWRRDPSSWNRHDRVRLDMPVVPVRLDGLDRVLHHTWKFGPRAARVSFEALYH
jgi:hypothetical protein